MQNHVETLTRLRNKLIDGVLERIPYTRVNGSLENRLPEMQTCIPIYRR